MTNDHVKEDLILNRDAAVLRKHAKNVSPEDIASPQLDKILATMKKALYQEDDGVAIAAPQIGESVRIFMVRGSAYAMARRKKVIESEVLPDLVFINPEITKRSKKKKKMEEGCLSVRWLYGEVERHEKVHLAALNEKGEKISMGASGLLAQIFQHETDHLDGVLFIDKAENVHDLPPANMNKE